MMGIFRDDDDRRRRMRKGQIGQLIFNQEKATRAIARNFVSKL
jgi:hypothetical protein